MPVFTSAPESHPFLPLCIQPGQALSQPIVIVWGTRGISTSMRTLSNCVLNPVKLTAQLPGAWTWAHEPIHSPCCFRVLVHQANLTSGDLASLIAQASQPSKRRIFIALRSRSLQGPDKKVPCSVSHPHNTMLAEYPLTSTGIGPMSSIVQPAFQS